ncbi:MAG: YcxB family protein [Lachnospiraceae bacterium]|uniref:YcxB family protein n=1 Tax=Parablautia sp. Marseille-Q6255 TaxID=3039593 RepID=UPI0024BC49B1|nr:YcxB family protein [Parablautia sp. Marseille-Q6255]
MKTEFDMKMTTGAMYRFFMYHAYHGFSGIFGIVAGTALLVYFFTGLKDAGANHWIYLLFGVIFLLYQPWSLYTMAVRQAKLNPVFKHPLHYALSEEGMSVTQGESASDMKWDAVKKVRETGSCIYVYTGKKNACIWIKSQMGEQEARARQILKKQVPEKLVKLRK